MESIHHVAHALQVCRPIVRHILLPQLTATTQAFAETSFAMVESGCLVVYTFLDGLAVMYWDTLESVATFLSISMNWLYSESLRHPTAGGGTSPLWLLTTTANIAILAVFLVAFMVYRTTGTTPAGGSVRSAHRSKGKKKA